MWYELPICTVTCPARDATLGDKIEWADGTLSKMKGLLGRSHLEEGQGILLKNTGSIHMFFMQFPIDVVYLTAKWRVAKIDRAVQPWAMSWAGMSKGVHALELPANLPALDDVQIGDLLLFEFQEPEDDEEEQDEDE